MTQRDENGATYVRDLVRRGDQDRYWSALLAPEPERRGLLALYAFNIELARVPEQVKEPQLGEIRLEWWRGGLGSALAGEPADHPVLAELASAAVKYELPSERLEGMIEARRFDLRDDLMPDFTALEDYLQATAGAVFELGARILGARETQEMSAHAAAAYGLTGLIRAVPFHASRGKLFLPGALLAKHGLRPEIILHGTDNQDVRAALGDMRRRASDALGRFRQLAADLPRRALPAFLPLALVPRYLKKLAAPGHRPLSDIVQLNPMVRYGLILRADLRGRI